VWITCRTAPNSGSRRETYFHTSAIVQRGRWIGLPLYLFFQGIAAKGVGEFDERLELSFDNGLVKYCDRFWIFNYGWRRRWGRRGWCGW